MHSLRSDGLPPYPLGELSEKIRLGRINGRDIIDLSQINPDSGAPQVAVDRAIQSLLLRHHHKYSSSQGIKRLREEFCTFYRERFGVELQDTEECVVTMGIKEGLGHLLLGICGAGDNVVILTPSYPVHPAAVSISGATSVPVSLFASWDEAKASSYKLSAESDSFFSRLSQLFEHTWPKPKAIILSFPHNPTTATVELSFFERLVDFSLVQGCFLLHDFAHAEIFFEAGASPSILSVKAAKECAVEFYSLSKSFQMPGWRVGFAVGNARLVGALKRVKSYLDFGVFQPVQLGALAALENGLDTLEEARERFRSRRELILEGLNRLGWECAPARGSMFIWARLPEELRKEGSGRVTSRAVDEISVAFSPGSGFDPSADEFCRFALGEPENRIRDALRRLESYGS